MQSIIFIVQATAVLTAAVLLLSCVYGAIRSSRAMTYLINDVFNAEQ